MIYDNFGDSKSTAKEKIINLINWMNHNTPKINNIIFMPTCRDLENIRNIIIDKTIKQSRKKIYKYYGENKK